MVALSIPEATPICGTTYTLDDADPNESPEIVQVYWKGIELVRQGHWADAKILFTEAVSRYPESRHLHKGLAEVLWYLAEEENTPSALEQASREIVQAVEIGLKFNKVRHTWLLAQILGRIGDLKTLNNLFTQILALGPTFTSYLDYAAGLSLMDDPGAELAYLQAVRLQPKGNVEALVAYSEWLLDHGGEPKVLTLLPADVHNPYLHFLRGVALERLKRLAEAKAEYAQFSVFSADFPAPSRYRIPGSPAQAGIQFDDNVSINSTTVAQAIAGLSTLIWGEARGENDGGQRAMGWVVRNRVLRGSVGQPACPYVNNSGATLADKYKSVMCQSGQFAGMCSAWCNNPSTTTCPRNAMTDHNASDVYYGYAPDPVVPGGYCPGGYNYSTCYGSYCPPCDGNVHCNGNNTTGYSTAGGLFNIGVNSTNPNSCPTHFCAPTNRRMTCNDQMAPNNCFYTNP